VISTLRHDANAWLEHTTLDEGMSAWELIKRDGMAGARRVAALLDATFGARPTRIYSRQSVKQSRRLY